MGSVGGDCPVRFDYRLVGTGWVRADIADGTTSAVLTASYLGDALGELLNAVLQILDGADAATCSWEEEPGEYRWLFRREHGLVHLRILWFDDSLPASPDEAGRVVFESRRRPEELAAAITAGADRVLDQYGEAEYLRLWVDFPFPTRVLERLRARLLQ
jgi:hypothetical protein